jgi:hypothetical protein
MLSLGIEDVFPASAGENEDSMVMVRDELVR